MKIISLNPAEGSCNDIFRSFPTKGAKIILYAWAECSFEENSSKLKELFPRMRLLKFLASNQRSFFEFSHIWRWKSIFNNIIRLNGHWMKELHWERVSAKKRKIRKIRKIERKNEKRKKELKKKTHKNVKLNSSNAWKHLFFSLFSYAIPKISKFLTEFNFDNLKTV